MALREELSKLDSAVAAGQITADEFRLRRDRLLAAAGSGPATGAPFPPPYRWGEPAEAADRIRAVPRPAPAEDRTQVVARPSVSVSERTQVVRRRPEHPHPPAPEDRTQVVRRSSPPRPPADADHTQVVRAGEGSTGYANVGAPPWARGPAAAPPTASSPLRPEGTLPPWTLNQPAPPADRSIGYVNASAFRAQRSSRWLLLAVALLVVLLIVGVVLFFTL